MDTSTKKLVMNSPAEFRKRLRIPAGGELRTLDSVMDEWQRKDFESLDAGWMRTAGVEGSDSGGGGAGSPISKAYLERPRGHSKTGDIAIMASWILFAAKQKFSGNVIAGDKEQARLVRESVRNLVLVNSWLGEYLIAERDRVKNPHTLSELTILSSDASSLYGQTPAVTICDELTHWSGAAGEECWVAAYSGSAKLKNSMLVIISNAGTGMGKSWQWRVRETARQSSEWYFSRLDGPQASWIDRRKLEEQQMLLPPSAYRRLWENAWTTNSGDALEEGIVQSCVKLPGPTLAAEPGWIYFAALDLGIKHDHSGFVVLGVCTETGRIKLCRADSWAPPMKGREVNIAEVEQSVMSAAETYGLSWIGFDPWQGTYLAQRLAAAGLPMEEIAFSGPNLNVMATKLLEAFRNQAVELYYHAGLLADLAKLSIQERNYGFRLVATADSTGHADIATAFSIALPAALELSAAIQGGQWRPEEDDDEDASWTVIP